MRDDRHGSGAYVNLIARVVAKLCLSPINMRFPTSPEVACGKDPLENSWGAGRCLLRSCQWNRLLGNLLIIAPKIRPGRGFLPGRSKPA